jgi:demethylspheroidene O-methyltransferase
LRLRNGLLRNRHLLRFAESFPLTRPRAQAEASRLFDLCSGFVYSQVLLACVELGILHALQDEFLTAEQLAVRTEVSPASLAKLLTAATALKLVEQSGEAYTLGFAGAAFFASPGLEQMVRHHALLYRDLADPVQLLRHDGRGSGKATNLSGFWPYARDAAAQDDVEAYTALMAATQPAMADQVIDAVGLHRARNLLDIGGGNGTFAMRAVERYSNLQASVFDLPAVVRLAESAFDTSPHRSRLKTVAGDFIRDEIPAGAEAVTLIRILLDHDDETCARLLCNIRRALAPNSMLIVAEAMADMAGFERVGAYFSFYLMAMGRGRPRSQATLTAMLKAAGFTRVRRVKTRQPLLAQILMARP